VLSIRIESAAPRFRAPGGLAAPARVGMAASAAVAAYGTQRTLLPMADARGDVQGAQCAWSPPV
jgi:hypothetical protein